MTATAARGRRALAVLTTAGALLLPATVATAAPAEQANERASQAQADNADRRGDDDTSAGTEWTEDDDTNDGDTPNNVADDGDDAHPSGRDRSVEHGSSGNQGNAQSDPDDDGRGPDRSNGGADQPNGPGGVDLADQDGNNGCGNDDDFEDDNEGWCGKPERDDEGEEDVVEQEQETVVEQENEEQEAVVEQEVGSVTVTRTSDDACPAAMTADADTCHDVDSGVLAVGVTVAGTSTDDTEVTTEVLGVTFTDDTAPASTSGVLAAAIQEDDADEDGDVAADGALPRTGAGIAGLAAFGLSALAGGTALSRRRD